MIRKVRVKNYKSIPDLELELGRVTALIGANGSGKSNILEAIALAACATRPPSGLDNEFLVSRGIRVTETRFMTGAFSRSDRHAGIRLTVTGDGEIAFECELAPGQPGSYSKLLQKSSSLMQDVFGRVKNGPSESVFALLEGIYKRKLGALPEFLIYSPENSALRTFQAEGQILPLGVHGEGLFAHLKALDAKRIAELKERLALVDWFDSFQIPENLGPGERSIRIHDRFLPDDALFDQRSANEGFLFLLFYITLFVSPDTPAFFSIDNIDSSLNPKLCVALLQQITKLAKEHDKQVILTTHNPAVLDGLDLRDDEQRLLVVERNKEGHTRVRRVDAPTPIAGRAPVSLSEAFLRGYIGGLPKNF